MRIKNKFLFIIGIICIAFSIVCFSLETGYSYRWKEYGGDAYTGIQQAAAQTSENVEYLSKIVKIGFGGLFLVGGLILFSLSIEAKMDVTETSTTLPTNNENFESSTDQSVDDAKSLLDEGILTQEEYDRIISQ